MLRGSFLLQILCKTPFRSGCWVTLFPLVVSVIAGFDTGPLNVRFREMPLKKLLLLDIIVVSSASFSIWWWPHSVVSTKCHFWHLVHSFSHSNRLRALLLVMHWIAERSGYQLGNVMTCLLCSSSDACIPAAKFLTLLFCGCLAWKIPSETSDQAAWSGLFWGSIKFDHVWNNGSVPALLIFSNVQLFYCAFVWFHFILVFHKKFHLNLAKNCRH